jgi:hypothetical protein
MAVEAKKYTIDLIIQPSWSSSKWNLKEKWMGLL